MTDVESELPEPGDVIDRYTVLECIGAGGMATVYRVRHDRLGTEHAMKVLHVHSSNVRRRLVQEGQVQAKLEHPNLVSVTDLVELPSRAPGIVMELVRGPTLEELLQRAPPDVDQVDHLARGILAGVAEAHRHGIVHRDLKPANVLLSRSGDTLWPKVSDFGIAKVLHAPETGSLTRTGHIIGTPQYMAPEQMKDSKTVGPAADVFSLGAMLYEMVTHRPAFAGDGLLDILNRVAGGEYVPVRDLLPDVPDRMVRAIEAALAPNPDERPASVDALTELWSQGTLPPRVGFAPFADRSSPQAPTSTLARPTPAQPSSAWSMIATGAAAASLGTGILLLTLAGLVVVGLRSSRPAVDQEPTTSEPPRTTEGNVDTSATQPARNVEDPATVARTPAPPSSTSSDPDAGSLGLAGSAPPSPALGDTEPEPGPVDVEGAAADEPTVAAADDEARRTVAVTESRGGTASPDLTGEPAGADIVAPPKAVVRHPVASPEPNPGEAAHDATSPSDGATNLPPEASDERTSVRRRLVRDLAYRTDTEARIALGAILERDRDAAIRELAWSKIQAAYRDEDRNRDVLDQVLSRQLGGGPAGRAVVAARLLGEHTSRASTLIPGLQRPGRVRSATLLAIREFHSREPDFDWRPHLEPLRDELAAIELARVDAILGR